MDNQEYNNNFNNQNNRNNDLYRGYNNTKEEHVNQNTEYYNTYQYNYNQNNYDKDSTISSAPPKEKLRYGKVITFLILLVLVAAGITLYFALFKSKSYDKSRTFMIYMVGSDLESNSKQGTFSISDIVDGDIDLSDNNVLLMVGGAKKWHNFVSNEEIGIYELRQDGFEKVDSLPVSNMGDYTTLEKFLNYSYDNYKSENYDLIFWNHGLGAIGIEQDEVSNDYLSLEELDNAFKNSSFNNNKLELTIFYNCLASNLHIANIMKNYSEYMVASEEVFYLSKVLNRLNFLGNVDDDNSAYDIGYEFIKQSDKVVASYNDTHTTKIDSTLAIIDLSKIDNLNNKLNNFVNKINISGNYYSISSMRRKLHTYGRSQTVDYDTVDLYELVESLGEISNTNVNDVLDSISDAVMYTSNFNDYSNGISIYFPYFGSNKIINMHLNSFEKIWNDNYYKFINDFYQIRSGTIRARRDLTGSYNKLENDVIKENNNLVLELTEKEKEAFESANVYIFRKENDDYNLLLQSNKVELNDNKLIFNDNKLLNINDEIISLIDNDDMFVYGKLNDKDSEADTIFYLQDNKISKTMLNSSVISNSLLDYLDYDNIEFSKIKYNLFENGEFNEYFKDEEIKENIKMDIDNLNISLTDNLDNEYYVLFEMYDIYNDVYYSKLEKING